MHNPIDGEREYQSWLKLLRTCGGPFVCVSCGVQVEKHAHAYAPVCLKCVYEEHSKFNVDMTEAARRVLTYATAKKAPRESKAEREARHEETHRVIARAAKRVGRKS